MAPIQGLEPSPTDGRLIYAVGDLHGCYALLCDLLAAIAADFAKRASSERPLIVFLGDYIDRGPRSDLVIEALVGLQRRTDLEVRLLKGNHEQALLEFLDAPETAAPWLAFGGAQTLAAYGVAPPRESDGPAEFVQARDALIDRMPDAHRRLLETLELMITVGDYAFVHAGVRPGVALERQDEHDLLWIRGEFLDSSRPFGKVIVHGHTWNGEAPQIRPNRLGLDTGAFATGVLTAMRLKDCERELLQVRRPTESGWSRWPSSAIVRQALRRRPAATLP